MTVQRRRKRARDLVELLARVPTGARGQRRGQRARALREVTEGLRVVFQPIRRLHDNELIGYEALSRFPAGTPDSWFTEAHDLGLGVHLEMTAIIQAVALRQPDWGHVSINVSATTVLASEFVDLVGRLQEPRRLVVELTEHAAVADYNKLDDGLRRLRDAGVRVAVDQASGGLASDHIRRIAPDIIKVDRSLIADLDTHVAHRASVKAIVESAAGIGASVVAEGIEREEERAASLQLGVQFGQGYLLGRPIAPFGASPPRDTDQSPDPIAMPIDVDIETRP